MKRFKNSKYEYWKWILLNKHNKMVADKYHTGIVAVYNPIENIIFRFDTNKNTKVFTRWKGLDDLFETMLADYLTIGELEEFYKSLPSDKKQKFWKCLSKSMAQKGE